MTARDTNLDSPQAGRGVLFVSHEATRSGAPTELLHFLRWFKKNGNRPFAVLLGCDGELTSAFHEVADTWSLDRTDWRPESLRSRFFRRIGLGQWTHRAETAEVVRFVARCAPALVYANSIASARVIEILAPEVPVLTHVHELEFMFRALANPSLGSLMTRSRRFIACSKAVRENLIREHGVDPKRVETVYEAIPVRQTQAKRTREEILRELHLPDDAFIVAGCGTVNWIKGPDLFVQVAREMCHQRPQAFFMWIGGGPALELAQFEHDARLAGLGDRIRFTGAVSEAADYLAAADAFALTSRQDSYPLTALEAAALQKPIVCFAGAGGMPEFVEDDCGFVVPYLDVKAMADRLICLLDSPERQLTMGGAARRKVEQRHDIGEAAPRIKEIIERTIAGD